MSGIYIHIPFCKQACHYCNFHFSTNLKPIDDLVAAIVIELEHRIGYLSTNKLETIYFGGGTPSLLSLEQLAVIIKALERYYDLSSLQEFTLEANPEDVNNEKLSGYIELGIDRLSLGFQSLDQSVLRMLNRSHENEDCFNSFSLARAAGFKKISIDLIYGIPGRNHDQWINDIQRIVAMAPEHISAYALTVEEKTALAHMINRGEFEEQDEDFVAKQFEIMLRELKLTGYNQYEISNFCKQGWEAVHNSNYWQGIEYLGLGPGAHSFNGVSRQYNIENNNTYIRALKSGKQEKFYEKELLSQADRFNEYLLTSLRTQWGTDLNRLKFFSNDIDYNRIQVLEDQLLVFIKNNILYLTDKGKLLADEITAQLILA